MNDSTALICPVCEGTSFVKKNNEGSLLIACEKCGHSARVSKAGIVNMESSIIRKKSKTFPVKRERKKDKKTKTFYEISFRVPLPIKRLIQAALFCAKEEAQIVGKWYAGASLGNIMADYISGFDFEMLDFKTKEKVHKLLDEVAESVKTEEAKQKNFGRISQDDYKDLSIKQANSVLDFKEED